MPHSEKWAKELLGHLPADPADLLTTPSFCDPTFLRVYLDHLGDLIFNDPVKGLKWAKVAPQLALKVSEDEGPEGRQAHRQALLLAHAILAGAYRATSQHAAAEEQYQAALRIADTEAISPQAQADLNLRIAHLRACQSRPQEALSLANRTLETYGPEPSLDRSRGLLWRGYALGELGRFAEAVECFGEALQAINPKESTVAERTYHATIHNLACAILKAKIGDDVGPALEYVRKTRKLLKGQRRSVARWKLTWVEGLIWRRLGMDARAEQAFKVAREGFINLRLPWEIALVSLDLCAIHRDHGEWEELETLASATCERFRALSGNTQALAALSLCVDAARARQAISATAGQEMIVQAQHNAEAAVNGARELIVARAARP